MGAVLTNKIIPLDMLVSLTSEASVEQARKSMDKMSVSNFKMDARGRLEGGVRPAPPSTEPSSYAKITRRGSRVRVECRKHGRDRWCLHAIILALHHIGVEPIYKTVAKEPAPKVNVGLEFIATFSKRGLTLQIRSRSGSGFVNNPARLIEREYTALGLDSKAATSLKELGESDGQSLHIDRLEAADALEALKKTPLSQMNGQPFLRKSFKGPVPKAHIRIVNDEIHWQMRPPVPIGAFFFPGWPGYLVIENQIQRVAGHLPDLQRLVGKPSPMALDGDALIDLMRDKHGIRWGSSKPRLVQQPQNIGVDMQVEGRDLLGRVGLWDEERFYPLNDLEKSRQVLRDGQDLAVLDTSDWHMSQLGNKIGKARLPMSGDGRFRVREQMAPQFLKNARLPNDWRIDRHQVDRHFGLVTLDVQTLWTESGTPRYQVGDETFDHQELEGNLLENGQGAQLPDGRLLSFDVTELVRNDHILRGAAALHEDEQRREALIARVNNGEKGEDGPPLEEPWRSLLRPYQSAGVRWMTGNLLREEPALLADDMGLGKTIQTLAMLDTMRKGEPQLVVVPTSLLANWREEAARFCPNREVTTHHGPKRTKEAEDLAKADLVLTSYGTMLRDIDMLYDVCFDVVVLDEAQAIKNANSRTAKAAGELWCNHRVALTGTPVENRMTELWSIFQFLAPDYLGEEDEVKIVTTPGTAAYEALKSKAGPFLLRRKKEEVADELPAKVVNTILLPMEEHQASVYQQYRDRSMKVLREDGKKTTLSILTQLLRLRQACCHPGLLEDALVRAPSNKVNYLVEQLQQIISENHGALVFSQFTKLLALVRYALEEAEIPYLYLDGRSKDRQDLVHRFQEGEAPVFLISLKAGGVGLNLTRASYVYHLDPWWNPAVEAQATDRAHRIGQKKKVFSYKLISSGTVEERILRLQAGKRFLSEGLWEDADKLMANLDRDTLMGLLS